MWTVVDIRFRSVTPDVVQPNENTSASVRVADEPTDVPAQQNGNALEYFD